MSLFYGVPGASRNGGLLVVTPFSETVAYLSGGSYGCSPGELALVCSSGLFLVSVFSTKLGFIFGVKLSRMLFGWGGSLASKPRLSTGFLCGGGLPITGSSSGGPLGGSGTISLGLVLPSSDLMTLWMNASAVSPMLLTSWVLG